MKKKTKTKPKTKPHRWYVKELDRVFSLWVRSRSVVGGYTRCFTCNVAKPSKEMQAGHYISRSHKSLRWDEQNVQVQCVSCNIFKKGNMDVYAIKLIAEYGDNILIDLQRAKNQSKKFSIKELVSMIDLYKNKL